LWRGEECVGDVYDGTPVREVRLPRVTALRRRRRPGGEAARAAAQGVAPAAFRETLSRVPSPVTIVTTIADGRAHGTTVSAFTSLSADPPLVLIALDRTSDLLELLRRTPSFAVNLLASDQADIGLDCARKGDGKLTSVRWRPQEDLPRVENAAAWLACEVHEILPGGDHEIVIGLVTACETGAEEPLVYHRRRFLRLGGVVASGVPRASA
jgi:flavin reductase (DIM6/NTAB) family NADH-FMN oxidoreductase RutF